MIAPKRVKWNNVFSDELNIIDLITDVAFDSDQGETEIALSRVANSSESYDGRRKYVYSYKYENTFSPKITFVKRNWTDFSPEEVRMVTKYLTGISTTSVLNIYYTDTESVDYCCIGNFVDVQLYKIANGRVVGIIGTFESVTPYALSDLYIITKTISSPTDNKITINIDTDEPQAAVYPRVTIKHNGAIVRVNDKLNSLSTMIEDTVYYYKESETSRIYYWRSSSDHVFRESSTNPSLDTTSVKLTNKHTDIYNNVRTLSPTIVKGSNSTETVTIDGANKIISSSSVNRIFGDDFENWRWLPLYDGKNEITVEGNCTVTLEYRVPLKVGEF